MEDLKHLGIIMDGNGRFAQQRGLPRFIGHTQGKKVFKQILEYCVEIKLPILTVFTLSSENWYRPISEVNFLLNLFYEVLNSELENLLQHKILLKIIGNRSILSLELQKLINHVEKITATNISHPNLQLNLAVNYGGKWDIVEACKKIFQQKIKPDEINLELFKSNLSLGNLPEIDLLIRTGGEKRLSNFTLWHLAYSELYFSDTLWPSFSKTELQKIIYNFKHRNRRFGLIPEQIC